MSSGISAICVRYIRIGSSLSFGSSRAGSGASPPTSLLRASPPTTAVFAAVGSSLTSSMPASSSAIEQAVELLGIQRPRRADNG